MPQPAFLQKPLTEMTHDEWESLCDGCGLCCQIQEEDEDTGRPVRSNVACQLLCLNSLRCTRYAERQQHVPECIQATPETIHNLTWLPETCGYRRAANRLPLPDWHHLVCGDPSRVHTHGPSMRGKLVSEIGVDWSTVEWEGD